MRVFLTGATGYVGSAVLEAFVRAGHRVTTLVRHSSTASEASSRPPGIDAVVGDLSNPASYIAAAAPCDALVHTAFESSARGASVDRVAVEALMDVAARVTAAGRRVAVIYTSSASVLGNVAVAASEDAAPQPPAGLSWRPAHETAVLESAASGARAVVVRPGIVYGGAQGAVTELFQAAANGLMRDWRRFEPVRRSTTAIRRISTCGWPPTPRRRSSRHRRVRRARERHRRGHRPPCADPADVRHVPLSEARPAGPADAVASTGGAQRAGAPSAGHRRSTRSRATWPGWPKSSAARPRPDEAADRSPVGLKTDRYMHLASKRSRT
jgi:uncharacterized protein YbjT (DUF2867 family)